MIASNKYLVKFSILFLFFLLVNTHSLFASPVRTGTLGNTSMDSSDCSAGHQCANLVYGSYSYDDDTNVFYNPAYLQKFKNNKTAFTGEEGGVFLTKQNYKLGVNYGREDATFDTIFTTIDSANFSQIKAYDNKPIEAVYSSKMFGRDVGAGFSYVGTSGKAAAATKDESIKSLKLNFGTTYEIAPNNILEGWFDLNPLHEGESSSGIKYEGSLLSFELGARSHFFNDTQYLVISKTSYEYTNAAVKEDAGITQIELGYGRNYRDALIPELEYTYGTGLKYISGTTIASNAAVDVDKIIVPVQVGIEYDLTKWFTVRSGFVYNLYNSETLKTATTETKKSTSDMIGPKIGGTITYNRIEIDFLYANGYNQVDSGSEAGSNNGIEKIGKVAVNYNW